MHELWVAGDFSGSVRTVSLAIKECLLLHFSIFTSLLIDRQELQLILFALAGLSSLITRFQYFFTTLFQTSVISKSVWNTSC